MDDEGVINFTRLKQREVLQPPKRILRGIWIENKQDKLIYPVAFVVKADYDKDLGLIVRR